MSELYPPAANMGNWEKIKNVYPGLLMGAFKESAAAIGCLIVGAVTMNTLGQTEAKVDFVEAEVGLKLDPINNGGLTVMRGGTHVGIHDIFTDMPSTHKIGPQISIEATDVDSKILTNSFRSAHNPNGFDSRILSESSAVYNNAPEIIINSLSMFGLGATFGCVFICIFAKRENYRHIFRGYAASMALVAITTGVGVASFEEKGLLEQNDSPSLAEMKQQLAQPNKLGKTASSMLLNASGVFRLQEALGELGSSMSDMEKATLKVVVYGDPHLNAVGSRNFMQPSIDAEGAHFAIGLGDWGEKGTAEEGSRAQAITDTIPTLMLLGNHDQKEYKSILEKLPLTTVVEKGSMLNASMSGLRILAVSDPNFTPIAGMSENPASDALRQEIITELNRADAAGERYDILALHDMRLLDGLKDLPVSGILAAHTHQEEFVTSPGQQYWTETVGSVSGASTRMFKTGDGSATPQQFSILYFDKGCRLIGRRTIYQNVFAKEGLTFGNTFTLNKDYTPDPAKTTDRCAQK